jgi:peptidoglycan/LPS O-acetylase OafA/YrhL
MGAIRFLLAVTVVLNHAGPLFGLIFTDAYIAIKIFFIISGFYMSLILSSKYVGPGTYRLFITNRFLRLFPAYWVVLALSFLASLVFWQVLDTKLLLGPWIARQDFLSPLAAAALVLANLSVYGQDILFFLGLSPAGGFYFDVNALAAPQPAWYYLLVPQAWTISLELTFYLLAPLLVRSKTRLLAGLIAASLAVRWYIAIQGLPADPWEQRFFPAEFGFFLLGILCHRLYRRITARPMRPWLPPAVTAGFLCFLLSYQFIPGGLSKELCTYVLTMLALPYAFYATRHMKFDRMVGELSYPIYISHWLIIVVLRYYVPESQLPLLSVLATVAFCTVFNILLTNRIERYRQKRVLAAA